MSNNLNHLIQPPCCPEHQQRLRRKPILWGLPGLETDPEKYILGGCLVGPDDPDFGYVCPVDDAVFIQNENGELILWNKD